MSLEIIHIAKILSVVKGGGTQIVRIKTMEEGTRWCIKLLRVQIVSDLGRLNTV